MGTASSSPVHGRTGPAHPPGRVPRGRLLLLLPVGLAVLAGLDAALLRLGTWAPVTSDSLASSHGVLMVYGFLGSAISLERAVALRSGVAAQPRWGFGAPAFAGLGTLLLIGHAAGLPLSAGRLLPGLAFMLAMAVLTAIYLAIWRRQGSFPLLVQILGAVAGLGGAALWTRGAEVALIVPWWACFLVLTILGERLELARVAFATGSTEKRVLAESCILLLLLPATLLVPAWGYPLLGVALTVLVADVGMHDVARRTIRTHGLTRLMAACMIAGYAWALVAAAIWILQGPTFSGYGYDLVVHAITIGFALSMVIAHAPVIIPAIVHRPLPYHPVMWVIAVILHGGLLTRALAGTRDAVAAWQFGGAASLLAVLALMVTVVVTTSRAERSS